MLQVPWMLPVSQAFSKCMQWTMCHLERQDKAFEQLGTKIDVLLPACKQGHLPSLGLHLGPSDVLCKVIIFSVNEDILWETKPDTQNIVVDSKEHPKEED